MGTQKFTLSILIVSLISFLPFLSFSQVDFSQFHVFDDEIVEDIQLNPEQVKAISDLETELGYKKIDLNNALLFHEDFKIEFQKVYDYRNQEIQKILDAEQIQAWQDRITGNSSLRKNGEIHQLKEKYLSDLSFLGLTDVQAGELTAAYMNWQTHLVGDREKVLGDARKEILTKKQNKVYKKWQKKEAKKRVIFPSVGMEEERTARQKYMMKLWKEFYLPNRAVLRNQFELLIDKEDQESLKELRMAYHERVDKKYASQPKTRKIKSSTLKEYYKTTFANRKMKAKELIASSTEIERFLQSDREIFYSAKDLAVKYDALIDGFEEDLNSLNQEMEDKFKTEFGIKRYPRGGAKLQETDYPNNKREMYFNMAFLLIDSDASKFDETTIQNHFIKAYPMPAKNQQTVEYELQEKSEIILDVVNAEGKVLKVVFEGAANEGLHVHTIDLNDISDRVFFYRLTTKNGTSTFKTMKF